MPMDVDQSPLANARPVGEMSLVEISEQLDKVTSWMEAERVKEREARQTYQQVAQQVEASIAKIRTYAQQLVDTHTRRINAFSGILGREPAPVAKPTRTYTKRAPSEGGTGRLNIGDAIMSIWADSRFKEPMTTDEISEALGDVGYKSNAAPTSLKSSINQSLAKLSRAGQITRYRSDGERIPSRDSKSRARKYVASSLAGDE